MMSKESKFKEEIVMRQICDEFQATLIYDLMVVEIYFDNLRLMYQGALVEMKSLVIAQKNFFKFSAVCCK